MKILLVHNYYQQPGGEDVVYEQERQLLESHGHQVVTYERKNSELLSYSAVQRLLLPAKTMWARDAYREILDLIRRERPALLTCITRLCKFRLPSLRRAGTRRCRSSKHFITFA